MKISFTTLGCPGWDLDTLCDRARAYGFDGVDFRGYLDALDVTTLPLFTTGVDEVRRKLEAAGLVTSGISTSITVCAAEALERNLDEARRTITLARALGAENARVFGGGDLNAHTREALAQTGRDTVNRLLDLPGAGDIHWLFETHDHWIRAEHCKMLLDAIPNPNFGALWDIGHTPRVGGETPAETYAAIGPRVGYTHLKDAVYDPGHSLSMADGWRYVAPGQGQLPLAEAVGILRENGYDGWLVFEHEKRWIPNLPEPEVAFREYAEWARGLEV